MSPLEIKGYWLLMHSRKNAHQVEAKVCGLEERAPISMVLHVNFTFYLSK